MHQELSRSYKEVCAPVIERCHFLFNELRPVIGSDIHNSNFSKILQSAPRWKQVARRVMGVSRPPASTADARGAEGGRESAAGDQQQTTAAHDKVRLLPFVVCSPVASNFD